MLKPTECSPNVQSVLACRQFPFAHYLIKKIKCWERKISFNNRLRKVHCPITLTWDTRWNVSSFLWIYNRYPSGKDPLESICKTWEVTGQIFCHIQAVQSDYLASCLVTSLKASSFSKAPFFVLLLTQKRHQFLGIKQPILQHLCSLWQQQLGSHSPPLFFFHLSLGLIKTASSSSSSFHQCKKGG